MISSETHPSITTNDEHAVRQIAILLQAMPERTHRVLLGQLNTQEKQSISVAMDGLGSVDAMEQHRVLQRLQSELQTETSRVDHVESEIRDEIEIGRARVSKKRSVSGYANDVASKSMDSQRTASTDRPSAATAESDHSGALGNDGNPSVDRSNRGAAGAGHPKHVNGVTPRPMDAMQSMFTQFHQTQAAGMLPETTAQRGQRRSEQSSENWVIPFSPTSSNGSTETCDRAGSTTLSAKEIAERIDRYLVQMPDEVICRALGQISTKQVFLVLCGLPNSKAESVLDRLPRRQAKKVRSDMRKMGQLQLSDIDAAKQHLAEIVMASESNSDAIAA